MDDAVQRDQAVIAPIRAIRLGQPLIHRPSVGEALTRRHKSFLCGSGAGFPVNTRLGAVMGTWYLSNSFNPASRVTSPRFTASSIRVRCMQAQFVVIRGQAGR